MCRMMPMLKGFWAAGRSWPGDVYKRQTQPCGARPNHGNRISRSDFSQGGSPVPGGQDIAGKQGIFIRHIIRNRGKAVIRKRYPYVFSLSSVNTASQGPASVLIRTVIHITPFAEKTFPAKCFHINRNPVSGLKPFYILPHLVHNPHKFVSKDSSRNRPWDCPVLDVDIAGTDCGQCHLYDRIPGIQQSW